MELLIVVIILALAIYLFQSRSKSDVTPIALTVLPEIFVVFDLETTGLKSKTHEIIEIGAIRFNKGTDTHDTFQMLVKPRQPIPEVVTQITGISQLMVEEHGESIDVAIESFRTFCGDHRLVCFNAEFDVAFLNATTSREGLPSFENPVSCALQMARRAWPGKKSYRLDTLAKQGRFEGGSASHRALEDARRALIVYAAAADALQSVE